MGAIPAKADRLNVLKADTSICCQHHRIGPGTVVVPVVCAAIISVDRIATPPLRHDPRTVSMFGPHAPHSSGLAPICQSSIYDDY